MFKLVSQYNWKRTPCYLRWFGWPAWRRKVPVKIVGDTHFWEWDYNWEPRYD